MTKVSEEDIAIMMKMRALGYTQKEIAQRLNLSQNAVSYQLRKVRELAARKGENEVINTVLDVDVPIKKKEEIKKVPREKKPKKGDKDVWLELKFLTEQYFGADNAVCKVGSPYNDVTSWKPALAENINAWEIMIDFEDSTMLELATIEAYKSEIEKLGYVFIDFDFTKEDKSFEMYARILKKRDYEKLVKGGKR